MAGLGHDALSGLTASPPTLPSKYHYDTRGSEIFEQITTLPEYYQTRTEHQILDRIAEAVVTSVSPAALVEFGSGSASKTRVLLDAMERQGLLVGYGAIEVSASALTGSAQRLVDRYEGIRVEGVLADFIDDVPLPFPDEVRLILFLGSTIGNLRPPDAVSFLTRVRERMTARDGFLIGLDLVKDHDRLVAAYNDPQGVTEQFSLNLLRVVNRELDGDLPIEAFRHRAIYNEDKARIESYVVAQRRVEARIDAIDLDLSFEEGDTIRTELSHKYTRGSAEDMLREAGLRLDRWDTDPEELFAVALTRRD